MTDFSTVIIMKHYLSIVKPYLTLQYHGRLQASKLYHSNGLYRQKFIIV